MSTFSTHIPLGGVGFVVRGGLDPYVQPMTVGQVRIKQTAPGLRLFPTEPCFLEEYMCVETGIDSGNVYRYGHNIFATARDAQAGVIAHQQAAHKERAERDEQSARVARDRRERDLHELARLRAKYEE